ncbi:unnamed protein product [Paramecium primaurelia]|uniref:Transmembrane protein n=2 Tax=Paramecium TaxID=5884 RepID=A0A8S1Y9R1_9CILI|nr:unnamed protein product [Paramecium primaurelia]CAD8210805.1 unnamed protein product [Paramecium pentaurelia]
MTLQFIYLILTFNNINEMNEEQSLLDNLDCMEKYGIDLNNLRIYNVLVFECYIPVLAYFILTLFCCQLCHVDKKLTGYRNRLIKQSFKLRLIIRISFELIIAIILILQFIEVINVNQSIIDVCYSNQLVYQFDMKLFYPSIINLMVFLLLVAFDNTCYFIIVCYTNDFYWGCYHDEELPIISVVETQSFSFAKNSVESSTDQQKSQDEHPSPYFGI